MVNRRNPGKACDRGRKLADLPKDLRDALERVDVDSDGRIRGFAFKDKIEAIERLLEQ